MPAELRFHAMGSTAHVLVSGGTRGLLELARRRIAELEERWSRFLPTSELSRINASGGGVAVVSADTFALLDRAVQAWSLTGGGFDPTTLAALRAAGYDEDFAAILARSDVDPTPRQGVAAPAPGCSGIKLYPEVPAVYVPPGVQLDAGGIGKGLAADLVTAELLAAGAEGAMVNLGGDVRVRGRAPDADAWSIAVEHPTRQTGVLLRLGLADGAVATSSRLRRRWSNRGTARHHLIDPRSGEPVATAVVAVTAVAGEGWWAEAATKSVFVTGPALPPPDATLVVVVREDGEVLLSPELEEITA